jgi:hypothetical protein
MENSLAIIKKFNRCLKNAFMKNTLMILLLMSSLSGFAQKNIFFADIGLPLDTHIPGVCVTYNRKLIRHFGVGIGIQEYYFEESRGRNDNVNILMPAVFADLRGYFGRRKGLFMLIADFGADFYHADPYGTVSGHTNGIYTGLGFGYSYRLNKRGVGPYVTLKFTSDTHSEKQYIPGTADQTNGTYMDGTVVAAIGCKF